MKGKQFSKVKSRLCIPSPPRLFDLPILSDVFSVYVQQRFHAVSSQEGRIHRFVHRHLLLFHQDPESFETCGGVKEKLLPSAFW